MHNFAKRFTIIPVEKIRMIPFNINLDDIFLILESDGGLSDFITPFNLFQLMRNRTCT